MLTNERRIETAGVPISPVPGTQNEPIIVDVPASKSITNRAIILAALRSETSRGFSSNCFCRRYDAACPGNGPAWHRYLPRNGDQTVSLVPVGRSLGCLRKDVELHLGNSGTCVRFLAGVLGFSDRDAHDLRGAT